MVESWGIAASAGTSLAEMALVVRGEKWDKLINT